MSATYYDQANDDCISSGYSTDQCAQFSRCVHEEQGHTNPISLCHPDAYGNEYCTADNGFRPAELSCYQQLGSPPPPSDMPVPPEVPPFDFSCYCPAHFFNPLQIYVRKHSTQVSMAIFVSVAALIVFIGVMGQ